MTGTGTLPEAARTREHTAGAEGVDLYLRERVRLPDCYDVRAEPGGAALYFVKGRVLSRSGLKTLFDEGTGARVFQLSEDVTSFLQRMYLADLRAPRAAYSLRKAGFLPGHGRSTLRVFRGREANGGEHFLDITTNWARTRATVTDVPSGDVLATFTRSALSARRLATGADAYRIRVNPGADVPFVVMLAVAFDEQYNDFNK